MGGGYTANNQHTHLKHIPATHKRARGEGERERASNKNLANQVILGSVGISKIELYTRGIL